MKIIRSNQTTGFKNSPTCTGLAFPFDDKQLNIAIVTVHGRYPQKGYVTNEVCHEIAYVLSGTGTVAKRGGSEQALAKSDAVLIEPGEDYYWEGNQLEMLMPCSPAFYPEQHREIS